MSDHPDGHPRYSPRVNRAYDPVLRRWLSPAPPWIWGVDRPRPSRLSRWLDAAGFIGALLLGAVFFGLLFWHPWT